MSAVRPQRRITATDLERLLGRWRSAPGGPRRASYLELADRVELLVVDGRLPVGSRMPAERELAGRLAVSRTTVASAYDALRGRDLLHSARGSGSTVSLPRTLVREEARRSTAIADLSHATLPGWSELDRHFAAAAARVPALLRTHALDFYGLPELREALAARYARRGVPTSPSQILVTLGAQHALGLVLRACASAGDRIAVDAPTYPHALDAFRDARLRLVPVPAPDDAPVAAEWVRALQTVQPALAYLMPDFHNPTGTSMSDPDRRRVLEAAARTGTLLVADETTGELDIDRAESTAPLAAAALDHRASVVTIGSASKTMWHGLRVGWIRADSGVVDRIASRRPASDLGTPVLEQLVVAGVLPEMEQLLAHRRAQLRDTRDRIAATLRERMPGWRVPDTRGGLALWVDLGAPVSSLLALTARTLGLTITSGPRFGLDGEFERRIRIPITAPAESALPAVELLIEAWTRLPGQPSRRADEFVPML